MQTFDKPNWTFKTISCASLLALVASDFGAPVLAADPATSADAISTATPIKHVIIIIGENRSFDHLFATYVPPNPQEPLCAQLAVRKQIINADGSPGAHFATAHQSLASSPHRTAANSSSSACLRRTRRSTPPCRRLPMSMAVGAASPYAGHSQHSRRRPRGLPAQDQFLSGTGGTNLSFYAGSGHPHRQRQQFTAGPLPAHRADGTPFDAFTGDTPHQYFTMVQQVDCAIDAEHVPSASNPNRLPARSAGCDCNHLCDAARRSGARIGDKTMAFFNMQEGDAPLFKSLADEFAMSDNYHQPVHRRHRSQQSGIGICRPGIF